MRKLLICLLASFHSYIGHTQNYRIESITVADGLTQGFVIDLFQDSRGFIWIGTSNGLNRYDGYQIKRFTPDNTAPWALKASVIYCIAEDANGLLWLGTENGLVVMDTYTERFFYLADINPAFPSGKIVQLDIRYGGRIWFSELKPEVSCLYMAYPPVDLTRLIRGNRLQSSDFSIQQVTLSEGVFAPFGWFLNNNDTVVVGADQQGHFCRIDPVALRAYSADPRTMPYKRFGNYGLLYAQQETSGFVFPLDSAIGGFQFMGFLQPPGEMPLIYHNSDTFLYQLDTVLSRLKAPAFEARALKSFIKLDKPVSYNGIVDLAGNIWMGTTGYGVRKISRRKLDFRQYLSEQSFYNFTLLPDGRLWPGYYQPHKVLNLQTGKLEDAPWTASLSKDMHTSSLLIGRSGHWWMGAWKKNRMVILKKEASGGQWKEMPVKFKSLEGFPIPMLEDSRGNIWIAGIEGEVARIRSGNNHVDYWQIEADLSTPPGAQLRGTCLAEDKNGNIWIGSTHGLVKVTHPESEPVFQVWHNRMGKGMLFKNDYIMSLYPDPNDAQIIWAGTRSGGLSSFNSQTGACETFTEKDGLVDNVVYGILPDTFGYLWLSTNRGLSRFNPHNRTFSNSPNVEPRLNIEFNTGAYGLMPSGELAFGSVEGLFLIRPLPELSAEHPHIVKVTQLKINGTALDPAAMNTGLNFTAQNEISLQIPFDQNNIALEFAALQTGDPASAQYRYRVLGLEEHWIPTGHQRTANLVAMPPGEYTIELQSIGATGNWSEAPVTRIYVQIRPPWNRSWPAWFLYAGLFALLLYAFLWYERRRVRLKYEMDISHKEMERLKLLDDFKNRFFGYISHEFKTPLTIIMGQAKRLPGEQNHQELSKNAGAIFQQGQSMLEMVDQMVDVTRLDNQDLKLNWRNGNFSDYVHYLVESLRSLAEFKNIRLSFHSAAPDLMMDFDPLRLKYIVNNLLSNAIRHTRTDGLIGVFIELNGPEQVHLKISDTGEGIAPEDLPNIFERYYRGKSGHLQPHHFGLGLAFVKDLLQLFAGKIEVDSVPGDGSTFTIMLPVAQKAPPLETSFSNLFIRKNTARRTSSAKPPKKSLPILLIVEDNPFISDFLQSCLEDHFHLEFAHDGLMGYTKALEIIPDLILTDVMMPDMDGYQLTQKLKNHELTAHIPIVMLSARSTLSDRLTGQQLGADAYIGKPFDEQELLLILKNLHRLQHRWHERYAGLTSQTGPVIDVAKDIDDQTEETVRQTDAFMLKMYALFEKNYPNEEYDLHQLSHHMEMSKSQLQRKLAALSDQSAMQLLRQYRLQKAFEILSANPDYKVKEICFQVGFKYASHFSRLFSKRFQLAPSDLKKNLYHPG